MQYSLVEKLINKVDTDEGDERLSVPAELFRRLLVSALQSKNLFDEKFYLSENDDIREAIKQKKIVSAGEHYFNTGYFEGRLPCKILVDERYYLEENPDIADAIRKGLIKNAQQHFEATGFGEGRQPHRGFSMF
jgi:hypothetical protein